MASTFFKCIYIYIYIYSHSTKKGKFFYRTFSVNVKSAMPISKIILISLKFICSYFKRWQIKKIASDLNRDLSSNFWWLRCENHVKLTEVCVMCTEKHV